MKTGVLQRWPLRALLLAVLFVALPSDSRAAAITIDFDTPLPASLMAEDYLEDGFRIGSVAGHYDLVDSLMQIDTFAGGHSAVRLDHFGDPFDFLNFAVALWSARPDGLVLDELAYLTSSNGGYAQITGPGIMSFTGSPWTQVSWVEFSVADPNRGAGDTQQDNLQFDNLQVSVPEPASILLLFAGAAGLALARRRLRPGHP